MPALEVGRGQVIEHQRPRLEVPGRQAFFDGGLTSDQPIHGGVELLDIDLAQGQDLAQRMSSPVQAASGGELGAGIENAGDHHRHDQVSRPASPAGDEPLDAELSHHAKNCRDVSVGPGALDLEGFFGWNERLATECAADEVDDLLGEVGEIADGLMLDLAVLPEASTEEVRGVDLVLVSTMVSGHMNSAASL